MSGKFLNKNQNNKKQRKKKATLMVSIIILLLLVIAAMSMAIFLNGNKDPKNYPVENTENTTLVQTEPHLVLPINLGQGLEITKIANYSGMYMEDGSDEIVTGVLMLVVTNKNELPLQYAELTLTCDDVEAEFAVSTLNPGNSAVLLEKNRMQYNEEAIYSSAEIKHAAFFQQPLSLCEDQVKIQSLDGAMNITNITDSDITEDITIYYKNYTSDMFYGGITYRIKLEGGLKAGELRQIMVKHFYNPGSAIVMVTCGNG